MDPINHKTWNWRRPDWPNFRYDAHRLEQQESSFLNRGGILVGTIKHLNAADGDQLRIELMSNEAVQTSAIEGEIVDRDSVQSSLRRQFGLKTDDRRIPPAEQGIAAMMIDLYRSYAEKLTHETMFRWHRLLTNGRRDLKDIGQYRTHPEPMVIASGRYDEPKIHFEAPPSTVVPKEMGRFVDWFNAGASGGPSALPALARAGIAHLHFVSIHPFEDGNGRISRALAEKVLAQSLGLPTLITLSDTIERRRKDYYRALEAANRDNDIDPWLSWFAGTVIDAQQATQVRAECVIEKTKLLDRLRNQLNPRQEKVILRMFQEGPDGFKGGMSAGKYIRIAPTSRATATRDLQDLVEKGALIRKGELKGSRYYIVSIVRGTP
ncbi:MAG: cell filamentation protein Fic [Elusimicrobia bacterium RIFCSPLOWO2_01_FULL_59_12]|nr:MAG: cell filamentation protein Fic [Elusimicrobia bacterium RIFCSPLOWO2_01_FULL_59_12]